MRHQPDLAPQRRQDTSDDSLFQDIASALAAFAFCGAVAFVLTAALLPELPA